jgi:hypothetical protein
MNIAMFKPPCSLKEPLIKSIMNRVADKNGILAATRDRETAACGRRGVGGTPAPAACAHRVMPPTPQSRMRGHTGLNQRFLK